MDEVVVEITLTTPAEVVPSPDGIATQPHEEQSMARELAKERMWWRQSHMRNIVDQFWGRF